MTGVSKAFRNGTRVLTVLGAILALTGAASAAVRHDGKWPDSDKAVSLDVERASKQDAIKKLADAAGWSVVMPSGALGSSEPVDIHVKNQPPGKVLDIILGDGAYVATRDGTLINIGKEGAPAGRDHAEHDEHDERGEHEGHDFPAMPPMPATPPVPGAPPMPPMPPGMGEHAEKHHGKRGEDRVVTGGHVTIEKGDTVGDVTVLGGSLDVKGEVEGDLAVFGGSVRIHDGAHVHGDAAVIGGALNVDDGATVDGDVGVIGGSLKRGDKAKIGGEARDDNGEIKLHVNVGEDDEDEAKHESKLAHLGRKVGSSLTGSALFFIFGSIFLALGTQRMATLKSEIAARPMKNFALGVIAAIAGIVTFVLLCVTVIGIPVALVSLLLAFVAVYAGVTAVLTTAGQALVGHKTRNPYVHLALGCALLLVFGALPWVGPFIEAGVILVGVGVLVATRCAGLIPPRNARPTPADPYRTAADL
jgi:hypothetical protein